MNDEGQPTPPDMELTRAIESMTHEQRTNEKRAILQEIADRESIVHLIDEVNSREDLEVTIIY